ncbi:YhdP family protein [Pollutimonas bauzanensis]|uniref:YhdP family protein n=1 Tax=Pollutimonas bauzanensis TaxID=658167 RepID=UPI003340E144
MFRLSCAFLKLLCTVALILYFLAAGLFLGVRYWALPNIDQWRPYIEQQLSTALKARVTLGGVAADWGGLNPRFELTDVSFTDRRQRKVLSLPNVQAVLSWRTLITGTPQFLSLQAADIDISVRRSRSQRLWVLGQSFHADAIEQPDVGQQNEVLAWLATQRQISLRNATIRWIDESRLAPPLVLKAVNVAMSNRDDDHHFSLTAIPPTELGDSLDVRGQFLYDASDASQAFSLQNSNGQLYMHVDKMRPLGWSPWVDLPQPLESGEVSAKGWLAFSAGQLTHFTSDIIVENGRLGFGGNTHVQADSLRWYMAGPWDGFQHFFPARPDSESQAEPVTQPLAAVAPAPPVEFRLLAENLDVRATDMFAYPLNFTRIGAQGSVQDLPGSMLRVQADRLNLLNKDMQASLEGSWQQGGAGAAGLIDIRGRFKRALITAIDEYLPNVVNLDAREWMAKGLVEGQINDADLVLKGDLVHFPFANQPSEGDFKVTGTYSDGVIDYLPAEGKRLGWPRLTNMQGKVEMHRASLSLVADQAVMVPAAGLPIQLNNVTAHIPDIEDDSVLTINGATTAKGEAYMALMTHSPLGGMLDGMFNEAKVDGAWEVPLSLKIPLLHSHDTTVDGAIHFAGSTVRLSPQMPAFTQVTGILHFTDTALSSSGLKADFLGGPVALSGGVGGTFKGLQLQGRATAGALTDYVGLAGMKRLQGTVPYKATLQRDDANALSLSLDSTLSGLALDLPAPLGKQAGQTMPLQVNWRPQSGGKRMALGITLGKEVNVKLLHNSGQKSGPFFYTGSVGVNQSPDTLAAGMNLDIRYPLVDADEWDRIITEFSTALSTQVKQPEYPPLPPVKQLRLQATQAHVLGVNLDELTFTARQPKTEQWRVDISSSQTAGTLFWREAKGRVAGRVDANFDRLSLGRAKEDGVESKQSADEDSFSAADDLDIPAVNLRVKNFRLYGRDVGELSLVGVNQARGQLWRLDELKLVSPSATLAGSGVWRLNGQNRGLTLDAEAQIKDFGAYLDQIGMKDMMKAGKGTVTGQFEWRNMPWKFSKSDLNGKITFDLDSGRFNNLNSRASRLLELLSLQSVRRLARLELNPASLTKEGFPYDKLRGMFTLNSGIMSTTDYRVIGPVGTIVIGGNVDLIGERLDLQAVVVPNLDVSGAAIAAGIAINPIVGVGAFLTQWLLQGPLAKAMTVEYEIKGGWDDPKIKEVAAPVAPNKPAEHVEP